MSVALLPDVLTGALLEVAVAWGADPTTPASGWTWTDITSDARLLPGIEPTNGRADEASVTQPATCTITLDNSAGRYTLGPQSSNYPNVRQGVPVRIRVRPATAAAFVVVFQGYAAEWRPTWNLRGTFATVALVAAGAFRRIGQGASVAVSAIRRGILASTPIVAYWPMEDGKAAANFAAPAGRPAMTWSGAPKLGASDVFDCSLPLPQPNGAVYYGDVPSHTQLANGEFTARAMISFGTTTADGSILLRVFTSGAVVNRADLTYNTGGTLKVVLYDNINNVVATIGPISFNVDGQNMRVGMTLRVTGGFVECGMNAYVINATVEGGYGLITSVACTAAGLGLPRKVIVNPTRGLTDTVLGHVSVETGSAAVSGLGSQLNAYAGEFVVARLVRLCNENGIPFGYRAFTDTTVSATDYLGVQRPDEVLKLLRDVELVDQGLLIDGLNEGLFYMARRVRESAAAVLTLDGSAQLKPSFDVVADDQRARNVATVSRLGGGGEATYRDTTGERGTTAIGVYDTSAQICAQLDDACALFAGWIVSVGTVPGYRYPSVTVDLRRNPGLVAAWLTVIPGTRIDITNVSAALAGHPDGTISLMVEGVTNRIDDSGWIGTARCSPYSPWRVGSYAADLPAGDDAWVARADTDGSTATAARTAGQTTLQVTTASGPLWTTTSTDYPLLLEVAGRQVRATACTGATSPQTFTVDALPAAVAAGAGVRLWQPTTPGL